MNVLAGGGLSILTVYHEWRRETFPVIRGRRCRSEDEIRVCRNWTRYDGRQIAAAAENRTAILCLFSDCAASSHVGGQFQLLL
jgi:hypothetical protein